MTLAELISAQKTLQEKTNPVPDLDNLYAAQLAEAGEISQTCKYGITNEDGADFYIRPWSWWHRSGKKPSTRSELLGEVLDLWLFTLVEYIHLEEEPNEGYYEKAWEQQGSQVDIFEMLTWYFAANEEGLKWKMFWLVGITISLGFSRDEVEKAYWEAYEKNVSRWAETQEGK